MKKVMAEVHLPDDDEELEEDSWCSGLFMGGWRRGWRNGVVVSWFNVVQFVAFLGVALVVNWTG